VAGQYFFGDLEHNVVTSVTPLLQDRLQATLGTAYTIERELGGGGMSRVFVAQDVSLGRRVVIKVLSPELASGVNGERFRREILLAAQLQHPHIVPVLAAGDVDALPFFIMPFVAGQSLRQRLDGVHGLPLNETVGILRDVAKALAHAHALGVVHRDIKPENVLISGGSAAVTDFGIAKALSTSRVASGATLTQGGTSLGTPAYMAPEQAAADPDADHRADIYSFGIVAYELLAGLPPFHGRPPQALLTAHMAETPAPLETQAPNVPPGLAALIMRCLAKSPSDRPPTAEAVLGGLSRLEISGSHSTVVTPVARPRASSRRGLVVAGLVTLVLLVGGYGAWRSLRSTDAPTDETLVAVAPFRIASADASLHYLRDGMLDLLAAKLTGEGGLRATEPRVVLTEWNRRGGSATRDLGPEASLEMADKLSAGRLLLGDVVGTPNKLILTVSLLDVPDGRQLSRLSVEGPPDSLAQLVDQVAARLLTTISGESDERLPKLTSTSLPALRAYLDGKAKLRRGQANAAARDFGRSLDHDSTFALAGLGLRIAASWYGDNPASERGLRAAYEGRDRLSLRDRALLEALTGPRYPTPPTTVEQFEARRRYLQIAPDRADAHEFYADDIFHFGNVLGFVDPQKSALESFRRSVDLDSTNAVAFSHILLLAVQQGDTALEQRLVRLSRLLPDSVSQGWLQSYTWYKARMVGDSATYLGFRDSVTPTRQNMMYRFLDHAFFDGTGIEDAWYSLQSLIVATPRKEDRVNFYNTARVVALVRGRPKAALAYLEQQLNGPADHNLYINMVRDAMMADGDTIAARNAAQKLAPIEREPQAADSARLLVQRAVIRAMEPWRLSRGDTSRTRESLDRLRGIERARGGPTTESQMEIAMIEAMHAHLLRRPDLREKVVRLDSLLAATDFKSAQSGRIAMAGIVAGLIFESLGENERAFTAVRRRATWWNQDHTYLATQLREEGRLAALAGHRDRAIAAYRHYLALRSDPDPALRPQAERIRQELLRLEATDVRR
jgi:serine/threonine-protein kinase